MLACCGLPLQYGDDALHYAIIGGHVPIAKWLVVDQGVDTDSLYDLDVRFGDHCGRTAFHTACESGTTVAMLKWLVEDMKVDPLQRELVRTPLAVCV